MVAYLVRVETEKAGGFRERPIFGQLEKKSKTFCGKSFTLIASMVPSEISKGAFYTFNIPY